MYPRNTDCVAGVAHPAAATETSTATEIDNGTNLVIGRTYSPPFWSQTFIPALLDAEDFRTVPGSEAELCGRYPRPTRRRASSRPGSWPTSLQGAAGLSSACARVRVAPSMLRDRQSITSERGEGLVTWRAF